MPPTERYPLYASQSSFQGANDPPFGFYPDYLSKGLSRSHFDSYDNLESATPLFFHRTHGEDFQPLVDEKPPMRRFDFSQLRDSREDIMGLNSRLTDSSESRNTLMDHEEEMLLKDPILHYGAEALRASDPCRNGFGDEMNENLLFRSGDMNYMPSPSRYVF